jgi:hypothetical protein
MLRRGEQAPILLLLEKIKSAAQQQEAVKP